jgi:hypothetical protein
MAHGSIYKLPSGPIVNVNRVKVGIPAIGWGNESKKGFTTRMGIRESSSYVNDALSSPLQKPLMGHTTKFRWSHFVELDETTMNDPSMGFSSVKQTSPTAIIGSDKTP